MSSPGPMYPLDVMASAMRMLAARTFPDKRDAVQRVADDLTLCERSQAWRDEACRKGAESPWRGSPEQIREARTGLDGPK